MPIAAVLLQEKGQIENQIRARIKQGYTGEALEQHWQKDGANGSP